MEWGPGGKASWQTGAKRRPWGDGGHSGAEGLGRAEGLRAREGGLEPRAPPDRPPRCRVDIPQRAQAQLAVVGSIRGHS